MHNKVAMPCPLSLYSFSSKPTILSSKTINNIARIMPLTLTREWESMTAVSNDFSSSNQKREKNNKVTKLTF
jgi:pyrroline-5-carboxylate reductase